MNPKPLIIPSGVFNEYSRLRKDKLQIEKRLKALEQKFQIPDAEVIAASHDLHEGENLTTRVTCERGNELCPLLLFWFPGAVHKASWRKRIFWP